MSLTFGCGRYQSNAMSDSVIRSVVYALGHKKLHLVIIDFPVRTVSLPRDEHQYVKPITLGTEPYPLAHAAEQMLRAAETHGITQRAKALLQHAIDSTTTDEEELESMENEQPVPETGNATSTTTSDQEKEVKVKKPAKAKATKKEKAPKKAAATKKEKAPKKAAAPKKEKAAKQASTPMIEIKKGAPKVRDGGVVHKAYLYWCELMQKHDDPKALDRGVRKEIGEKINAKFGIKSGANYFQFFSKHFGLPKK